MATTRRVARYGATVGSTGVATLTLSGHYASGELYVTVSKSEDWAGGSGTFASRLHTVEEYTDKQGRVVLVRTFNVAGGVNEMLSTYYVYDDLGQLAFVLPPGHGTDFNPDRTAVPTATQLNSYAYQYRYDRWGRVSHRRLPGTGSWESYNYNKSGWVVFHQDSRQQTEVFSGFTPGQYHTFYKYDGQGRVVIRGIERARSQTRETIEGYLQGHGPQWEDRSTSSGHLHGYTNNSIPGGTANMEVLEVHYYDRYEDIPGLPHNQSASHSKLVHGKLVASKAKVLGTASTYLWTVYYYDDHGRVSLTYAQHYQGGSVSGNYDLTSRIYTFTGLDTAVSRRHFVGNVQQVLVNTEYVHDHRDRLLDTWMKVNPTGVATLVSRNAYNEVGQVRTRQLHSGNGGASWGQAVTYSYNPRGWLRVMESPLFRQELQYTEGSSKQYGGNIAYQLFRRHNTASPAVTVTDTYTYTYDGLGRLTQGSMAGNKGRETVGYDRMGNIRTLVRTGTNSTVVDNLTYSYTGNRLTSVADAVTTVDANYQLPGTTSYTYDVNGNLKTRTNSGSPGNNISGITYNYLNLPQSVTATSGNVTYTYDGTGRKLRSVGGIVGQTRDYVDVSAL